MRGGWGGRALRQSRTPPHPTHTSTRRCRRGAPRVLALPRDVSPVRGSQMVDGGRGEGAQAPEGGLWVGVVGEGGGGEVRACGGGWGRGESVYACGGGGQRHEQQQQHVP